MCCPSGVRMLPSSTSSGERTCRPFPADVSPTGMVLSATVASGLTYLIAKHIFKSEDPVKWAKYSAAADAIWYVARKVRSSC